MFEFWVFHCPPGADREAAKRGEILCPMVTVFAPDEETVRNAFPSAVCIHKRLTKD